MSKPKKKKLHDSQESCGNCGIPWTSHEGIERTCSKLMKNRISKLKRMRDLYIELLDGNLTGAKRLARGHSEKSLFLFACTETLSWSLEKARAAAQYLKGTGSYQAYINAR